MSADYNDTVNAMLRSKTNSLARTCGTVTAVISWNGKEWDDLTSVQRNAVRDHLDAAIDTLNGVV